MEASARSRRTHTPREGRRAGAAAAPDADPLDSALSLQELAAGVAAMDGRVEQARQALVLNTKETIDEVNLMSERLQATLASRKVSIAEARRRRRGDGAGAANGASGGGGGGGGAGAGPKAPGSAGGGAAGAGGATAGRRQDVSGVSPAQLEDAARHMVGEWLERRDLARYAGRVVYAFQQAAYRPHEWTHTLDSMGDDELSEFVAALEQSPAPDEPGPAPAAAPDASERTLLKEVSNGGERQSGARVAKAGRRAGAPAAASGAAAQRPPPWEDGADRAVPKAAGGANGELNKSRSRRPLLGGTAAAADAPPGGAGPRRAAAAGRRARGGGRSAMSDAARDDARRRVAMQL